MNVAVIGIMIGEYHGVLIALASEKSGHLSDQARGLGYHDVNRDAIAGRLHGMWIHLGLRTLGAASALSGLPV